MVKPKPDDEPLPFATILEINGLDYALWCCRVEPQYAKEWRLFAVAFARRVQHLNTDPSVKNAIDAAERYANGEATDEELSAARAAAWDVGSASWDLFAAWNAAWAAWYAARAAASASAAAAAAADAASEAAADAAGAADAAARATAAVAAWAAEREWQTQEFLRVITETEERTVNDE